MQTANMVGFLSHIQDNRTRVLGYHEVSNILSHYSETDKVSTHVKRHLCDAVEQMESSLRKHIPLEEVKFRFDYCHGRPLVFAYNRKGRQHVISLVYFCVNENGRITRPDTVATKVIN